MLMAELTYIFPELATVHRLWGCPPSDDEVRLLLDYGIDGEAMTKPYPLGAANIRFDTFDVDAKAQRAITFRAEDRGEVIDLIAWSPRTSEFASWLGAASVSVIWIRYSTLPPSSWAAFCSCIEALLSGSALIVPAS